MNYKFLTKEGRRKKEEGRRQKAEGEILPKNCGLKPPLLRG
ncbi:MAG: hypothetical protein SWX82_25210 [Cyanobacteriota bacterium]|nr:hypothetical protein [Cyanobacteriota bacterium]